MFVEQRLIVGCSPSESEKLDRVVVEIDFGTDESMYPVGIDGERMSQDVYIASVVGASEVNDPPAWCCLQIQFPSFRNLSSGGCGFDPGGIPFSGGSDVFFGSLSETPDLGVLESRPDLCLPAAIETLDGRLKAGLVGDDEDGRNLQIQAHSYDSSNGVEILTGARETVVVVELSVGWQPGSAPMLEQGFDNRLGGDSTFGPGAREASVQGNPSKNRQMGTTTNRQSFDGVERVEFGHGVGDVWKIPTFGRCGPANSLAAIQDAMPFENTPNRAYARQSLDPLVLQVSMDCMSPIFSEIALFLEPLSCTQDTSLDGCFGALGAIGSAGTVFPVDPIQSLSLGTSTPVLNGRKGNREMASDGSHRLAPSHCSDHRTAILGAQLFEPSKSVLLFRVGMTSGDRRGKHCKKITKLSDSNHRRYLRTPNGARSTGRARPIKRLAGLTSAQSDHKVVTLH